MSIADAFPLQATRMQPNTLTQRRQKIHPLLKVAVVFVMFLIGLLIGTSFMSSTSAPERDGHNTDKTLFPLRLVATFHKVHVCPFGNSSILLVPDPAKREKYMDVGCAYYCVQPPLSAEDEAAGVDPTMLAYDVTPDEAAAEVSRRRSDPLYKWQDMFTCAWVPPEAIASTTCNVTKDGVYYQYIPPIAHTAMGPSDLKSPLNYVNANECPMDLIGYAVNGKIKACEMVQHTHVTITHIESSCKHTVYEKPCGAEVFSTHTRNKDGSPRPFYTYVGTVRGHYLAIQSYTRYVEGLASPELAAADAALQDELKPFYDRYIFPPLDTVSTFAAWSKRKSAVAAFIGKSSDGRAQFIELLREFYPVENLGKYNRTVDTLPRCERSLLERPFPVNGDPSVTVKGNDPLYSRPANAPSPLNTTAYSSILRRQEKSLRCAQQQYKFVLAFDNSIEEDYVTEKITNAMLSGAIPIFVGSPTVNDFTPDLECADARCSSVYEYPSVHEPSGNATMNIKKPFINIVTEFGGIDLEKSKEECLAGRSVAILQMANGTLPLQRLAEYLHWLETSPDAVERYLSWWRCSKWGAKFQSALYVPYYPCKLCARSHRHHQRGGGANSLGVLEPFAERGRRKVTVNKDM